jgi:hypothetical protein
MPIIIDNSDGSQSVTFSDVDVTLSNWDPTTGAAVCTFTAKAGFGTLPAILQGPPGVSPQFQIAMTQVPYGTALPSTNPEVVVIDPGGPGVPSQLSLNFYVNEGEPGSVGAFAMALASDIVGVHDAAVGKLLGISTAGSTPAFNFVTPPYGQLWWPSTINSTTSSSGSNRTLTTIAVGPMDRPFFPLVFGQTIPTSLDGTAQVNLVARVGNATTGQIVAQGIGVADQTNALVFQAGPPTGASTGAGVITAGTTSNIYINCEQVGGTPGDYSTSASTSSFCVMGFPIG